MNDEDYSVEEVAWYGPRGGTVRRTWKVRDRSGKYVFSGSRKKAFAVCEQMNDKLSNKKEVAA